MGLIIKEGNYEITYNNGEYKLNVYNDKNNVSKVRYFTSFAGAIKGIYKFTKNKKIKESLIECDKITLELKHLKYKLYKPIHELNVNLNGRTRIRSYPVSFR